MATITSNATGNSNSGGTWVGGIVPGSGDDVVIASTHVVTLDADHTWNSLTISSTTGRITPSGAVRVLNLSTFWRHSANPTAAVCVLPASCDFTVNLQMFDHTANGSQYVFSLAAASCQLNINSNNAIPTEGNLLDPVGVANTMLVSMTNASAVCTVNGYFATAVGQMTLFSVTAGTLTINNDIAHDPGATATSKILNVSSSGVVTATLNGDCNSNVPESTTGLVTVANANATVTINGDWYQAVANNPGALLHISNGTLILNGKASHVAGTNTLTVWVAGGIFRWESQSVTIGVSESLTISCTAGLLDLDDLLIDNYNKVIGLLTGSSTYSVGGAVLTNYPGGEGAFNYATITTVNTLDPAPTLPAIGKVEAGEEYGYAASPLTGTGLILDPGTLATALAASEVQANVTKISGDSTAADNLEAMLDGTGGVTLSPGAINNDTLADNAISSAKIAIDAIGSDEIAASAITKIQTGLATSSALSTLSGYVDTEVAAIKAQTDQMSFSTGGIIVSTNTNGDNLASVLNTGAIQTVVDAIQTVTDQFVFTVANQVDANALSGGTTPAAVADAVWDELLSGHATAGSTGAALADSGSGGGGTTAEDVWDYFEASTGDAAVAKIAAAIDTSSPGSGMHLVTFTIKQANGTLIADCDVNITTSSAGPNTGYITTNRSNANGVVNFYLDAGTYYGWKQKAGITFSTNPFQFSVDDTGAVEIL